MSIKSYNVKKVYLIFLIFSTVLVSSYVIVDYLFYANKTQQVALNNGIKKIKEREKVFNNFIVNSKNTLHSLRENETFKNFLENKKDLEKLNEIFLAFSKANKNFMQLRYIDKDGLERVRIDRKNIDSKPFIVKKENLQNKYTRYYFLDSLEKEAEKVWFSDLDLNIENGKVQKPYNPTIRAVIPIEKNNSFSGIIIINYFMDHFLDNFLNMSLYDSMLYNENGYILKSYDSDVDWSFYQKNKFTIEKIFTQQSENMLKKDIFKTENVVTNYLNVPTDTKLFLLLKLKDSYIKQQHLEQFEHYIVVATITFILSLLITLFVGRKFTKLINIIETKNIEQESLLSLFDKGDSVLFKWENDDNWSINYVSTNSKNLLGYTQEEFLSSEISYSDCIHPDDLKHVKKEVERGKKSKENFFRHEPYRIITKDGEIKWVLDYTVLNKNPKNEITHFIGYILDITQHETNRKNLEKFIDTQDNIVILTDGTEMNFANKKFFKFFGYEDLEHFTSEHECICEFFIENDRFFHLGKISEDDNWVEVLKTMPHSQRIVSVMSANFKIHAFSITINEFENNLSIVSFADISQTILEHIKLEEKTIHDKLTNAYNREYFEKSYQSLIYEYEKDDHKLAIAVLDIDHFKIVNDTYGHDVGDTVLIEFVQTIQKYSRKDDILIRWGGEEFILILKVDNAISLKKALEHIRRVIELREFSVVGTKTCSIGATLHNKDEDIEKTIKRADEAVYEAKKTGRNKVIINS